jgi:UDP-N-acetylglucosamine--N-acetylmuramyl-(pentapeptide) pyrophosphoryl-undecaprenol N-acetylglucosamine transferase
MRIILSGGGTGGSVTPLISIFEEIKRQQQDADFLWVAATSDPLESLIASYKIPIKKIFAGKLRRYFSLKNFFDPFFILFGFFQSLSIIIRYKPQVIISAGGFVSVPLVWAGWLLRKPCLIHQQDVIPGLANELMAPFANIITVTLEKSLSDFPKKKTTLVGNPFRPDILTGNKQEAIDFFKLEPNLPVLLAVGGGTGALSINDMVLKNLNELVKFCQIIHITGGKVSQIAEHSRYHSFDFLTGQLKNAYAISDLVVSRAGMSTLTELSILKKPTVIIPIPKSHQEANAIEFSKNNAAVLLSETDLTLQKFYRVIYNLISDKPALDNLSRNIGKLMPQDAASKIVEMIL